MDIKCNCNEFFYVGNPDETGVIIKHKACGKFQFLDISELEFFKTKHPDTKLLTAGDDLDVVNEDEVWEEILNFLPVIVMHAPLLEPHRRNYIIGILKEKYNLFKK